MTWIPGIGLKLVRTLEITRNFHRCKKFFEKFCKRAGWYRSNGRSSSDFLRRVSASDILEQLCPWIFRIELRQFAQEFLGLLVPGHGNGYLDLDNLIAADTILGG